MSPKAHDPQMRSELIEAAARLLADEGPAALTTRRLAREVGTSTMAVYTYFRDMDSLRHAVREEALARFAAFLDAVEIGPDPVAEVIELGAAYLQNALTNPHLYRFIFMEASPEPPSVLAEATFLRLVAGVERCVEAGRFRGDPRDLATELWVITHGVVSLYLVGLLDFERAIKAYTDVGLRAMAGMGDDPASSARSMEAVQPRLVELFQAVSPAPTGSVPTG